MVGDEHGLRLLLLLRPLLCVLQGELNRLEWRLYLRRGWRCLLFAAEQKSCASYHALGLVAHALEQQALYA